MAETEADTTTFSRSKYFLPQVATLTRLVGLQNSRVVSFETPFWLLLMSKGLVQPNPLVFPSWHKNLDFPRLGTYVNIQSILVLPIPRIHVLRYFAISIVFAILAFVVAPFDPKITSTLNMTTQSGDLRRIMALSEIFAHGFGVVIVIAGILFLAPQKVRQLPRLVSCLTLVAVAVHLIKHLVLRRRPQSFVFLPEQSAESWWVLKVGDQPIWNSEFLLQSFPSGHSANAFAIALGLSWMFPRGRILFFGLATMAMLQRIMFLAHWPSDCLFGVAIALTAAGNVFHAPLSSKLFAWIEKPGATAPCPDSLTLSVSK